MTSHEVFQQAMLVDLPSAVKGKGAIEAPDHGRSFSIS